MIKAKYWLSAILISVLTGTYTHLQAQTQYVLTPSPELKVQGGSTLHDWEMTSQTAKGEGRFIMEGQRLTGIQDLEISMEAESLKSGTRGLNNNAYKALDTKKHKEVKFVLKELKSNGSQYQAVGHFTISGVSKEASFPVNISQSGNKITFEGTYATKLTDFSIDPPTALMGTVKTKDDIKISFKTTFQPNI